MKSYAFVTTALIFLLCAGPGPLLSAPDAEVLQISLSDLTEADIRQFAEMRLASTALRRLEDSACATVKSFVEGALEGESFDSTTERNRRRLEELSRFLATQLIQQADEDGDGKVAKGEFAILEKSGVGDPVCFTALDILPELRSFSAPTAETPEPLLDRLSKVLSIRRSFLSEKDIDRPAEISWINVSDADETLEENQRKTKFDIRTALIFNSSTGDNTCPEEAKRCRSIVPIFAYEANVSTDATDGRDTITHRLGFEAFDGPNPPAGSLIGPGNHYRLTFDYGTDRDYRAEVLGATFQYVRTAPGWGIGEYQLLGSAIHARWQPYLTLSYAEVRDPGESEALAMFEDYANATLNVTLEMLFGKRLKFTFDYGVTQELKNEEDDHGLFSTSGRYEIDEKGRVSFVVSHQNGKSAPLFLREKSTKISLGIKL